MGSLRKTFIKLTRDQEHYLEFHMSVRKEDDKGKKPPYVTDLGEVLPSCACRYVPGPKYQRPRARAQLVKGKASKLATLLTNVYSKFKSAVVSAGHFLKRVITCTWCMEKDDNTDDVSERSFANPQCLCCNRSTKFNYMDRNYLE